MGEFSEYFEDFPEENPANQDFHEHEEAKRQRTAQEKLDQILRTKVIRPFSPEKPDLN